MKPVIFNNTVLRDGHQSLAATRMTTRQMLPAVPDLDNMGFGYLETWGGATIDSCLRFLRENPFERLSTLKELSPKTPHMMLLRGQNIVQYQSFPDDVVEAFVLASAKRGMDVFRIFDALNDLRNVKTAVDAVLKAGKHPQGAISYTTSPVHTSEMFINLAKEFVDMGCKSICIKDMAGLITPPIAAELVRGIKNTVKVPVTIHSHSTAGLAPSSYFAAVEAGVDVIDVSIAPFANGSGQPDINLMLAMLEKTGRAPSFDEEMIYRLRSHFRKIYAELDQFTSPNNERVDVEILRYQVPGGMMSNFRNQLKDQGMGDRLDEVMEEVPFVRKSLGWIPLVTPTSQIVGTQAMLNVKFGRWKMLSQPVIDIALGKYGHPPGELDPDLVKLCIKKSGQNPIEGRPADHLEPRMPSLRKELKKKGLPQDDETAVLYAMFPAQTEALYRPPPEPKPVSKPSPAAAQKQPATPVAPKVTVPQVSSASRSAGKSKNKITRMAVTLEGVKRHVTVEELS